MTNSNDIQYLLRSINVDFSENMATEGSFGYILNAVKQITASISSIYHLMPPSCDSKFGVRKHVGTEISNKLSSELGKLLVYIATNHWNAFSDDSALQYVEIGEIILSSFPDFAQRRHHDSGKLLIHHAAYRINPPATQRVLRAILRHSFNSASAVDNFGALPLHWAMHNEASSEDVTTILLEAYPSGVGVKDQQGLTPLHWAMMTDHPNLQVTKKLLEVSPEAAIIACDSGNLPLHICVNNDDISIELLKLFLKVAPEAAKVSCYEGWLPIHRCANRANPSTEALGLLIQAYPDGLFQCNEDGQTPIHRLVDRDSISSEAVALLLQACPEATEIPDTEGYLPLHLVLDCSLPDYSIAEQLLHAFPDAAKTPTYDGFLPLHFAVSSNDNPSPAFVHKLMTFNPAAPFYMVVDFVPEQETADPDNWTGTWVEKEWTPLSKAIEKGCKEVAEMMQQSDFAKSGLTMAMCGAKEGTGSEEGASPDPLVSLKLLTLPAIKSSGRSTNPSSETVSPAGSSQQSTPTTPNRPALTPLRTELIVRSSKTELKQLQRSGHTFGAAFAASTSASAFSTSTRSNSTMQTTLLITDRCLSTGNKIKASQPSGPRYTPRTGYTTNGTTVTTSNTERRTSNFSQQQRPLSQQQQRTYQNYVRTRSGASGSNLPSTPGSVRRWARRGINNCGSSETGSSGIYRLPSALSVYAERDETYLEEIKEFSTIYHYIDPEDQRPRYLNEEEKSALNHANNKSSTISPYDSPTTNPIPEWKEKEKPTFSFPQQQAHQPHEEKEKTKEKEKGRTGPLYFPSFTMMSPAASSVVVTIAIPPVYDAAPSRRTAVHNKQNPDHDHDIHIPPVFYPSTMTMTDNSRSAAFRSSQKSGDPLASASPRGGGVGGKGYRGIMRRGYPRAAGGTTRASFDSVSSMGGDEMV